MNRRLFACWLLLLPLTASAEGLDLLSGAQKSLTGSLSGMLQSQLGVTEDQAEGGLGSMLSLAQERLSAGDFDQLADAIPGASGYLETAKRLGAVEGPLGNVAGLNDALKRLGMSPDSIASFVPTVTDLIGKFGGADTAKLLQSVFGAG